MGKLLSQDDLVAKVPGTSKPYWAALRFKGTGPAFLKPSPKVVLYDEDVVDAWLASTMQTKTGEKVSA